MATDAYVKTVEAVIGYTFKRVPLIRQALTAAGAEENNYDGNRKLSQIGVSLVDTLLATILFDRGVDRAGTAEIRKLFLDKKHYSTAATQTGIDQCIKRNARTAPDSAKVHRNVINAIIAAVLLDSFCLRTTLVATLRIFMTKNEGLQLSAADPGLREPLLDLSERLIALETGAVNPAIDGQDGYPIAYSLLDRSPSVPAVAIGVVRSPGSHITTESELFEQFINSDMVLQAPFSASSSTPSPALLTMEDFSNDTLATTMHDAPCSLPSTTGVPEGTKRTSEDTTTAKRRKTAAGFNRNARAMIDNFLAQERAKCKDESLLPEHTYFNMSVQNAMSKFDVSLKMLLSTAAAPQQIASLRDIICSARVEKPLRKYSLRDEIEPRERFRIISELDERIAGALLVRWYHIVALFEACGGHQSRSVTGFVNNNPATIQPQRGSFGNPTNKDDASVAQAMMRELYPDLQPGTAEYQTKQINIKKLRKLGKRLHMLVDRFGRGVLGLMLPCIDGALPDHKLLKPNNTVFDEFVKLLDSTQGHILRELSVVVFPPLWAFLQGRLEETEPFPLEKVDRDQILALHKGSPDLPRLIAT
ncbi:hypothetical protein BDW75DRAFT_237505 [Aspergillus navahoensis]